MWVGKKFACSITAVIEFDQGADGGYYRVAKLHMRPKGE